MSKSSSKFQEKIMALKFRGKEIFKLRKNRPRQSD